MKSRVLLLDNLDSFSWNLVEEFRILGLDPLVYRNTVPLDHILGELERMGDPCVLALSPGPGKPVNAGCMPQLLNAVAGRIPILGICLGFQALVEHYGGTLGRAPQIVHGKAWPVQHDCSGPFQGLATPLQVARYHSLIATKIPVNLKILAKAGELPMAIASSENAILAYQFHPESILTAQGSQLLRQSVEWLTRTRGTQ